MKSIIIVLNLVLATQVSATVLDCTLELTYAKQPLERVTIGSAKVDLTKTGDTWIADQRKPLQYGFTTSISNRNGEILIEMYQEDKNILHTRQPLTVSQFVLVGNVDPTISKAAQDQVVLSCGDSAAETSDGTVICNMRYSLLGGTHCHRMKLPDCLNVRNEFAPDEAPTNVVADSTCYPISWH